MRQSLVAPTDPTPPLTGQPLVKSAVRVMDIFAALAERPNGLGFTELCRRLGLPKSSLHGLLAALTDYGYISFDSEQRTYSIGIRLWEHGRAYSRHRELLREAQRVMEVIVADVNETVQLATLDGAENVYLAKVDCSHPLRLQSEVGRRLPAHATGLGKVLLAQLAPDVAEARLAGQAMSIFTSRTLIDRDAVLAELETIRAQGFAVDDQEYTWGLRCVAVPICERDGSGTTALSASVPVMRASPDELARSLRAVAAGSIEISLRLGFAGEDPQLRRLTEATADMVAARLKRDDELREEV